MDISNKKELWSKVATTFIVVIVLVVFYIFFTGKLDPTQTVVKGNGGVTLNKDENNVEDVNNQNNTLDKTEVDIEEINRRLDELDINLDDIFEQLDEK